MSDLAAAARENAVHCEAKKHAYRQTQDGVVISFVLHPQDVPERLAVAALGTRYMLVVVELDDNEELKPKLRDTNVVDEETATGGADASTTARESSVPPSKQRKPVAPEKRLAQQAGICCADPVFQKFMGVNTENEATLLVRRCCNVLSRAEFIPGTHAGNRWEHLHARFLGWRDHDMPAGEAA